MIRWQHGSINKIPQNQNNVTLIIIIFLHVSSIY